MSTSKAVKIANKASTTQLARLISVEYDLPPTTGFVQVCHSDALQSSQKEAIWAMFEANMYEFYKNSSFGWDPPTKRKELFHPLSRFILVSQADTSTLLAFTMFRFEVEEGQNTIYCYDIQVSKSCQGLGLGSKMLNELAKLCKAFHMEKVMLTVLKRNTRAVAFYKSIGFVLDPTSPNYVESDEEEEEVDEDVDYEILSRNVT